MITYAKAKELISPGDSVWIISDGKVEAQEVISINADSLHVKDGFLDFFDHGQTWWLTKRVAMDNFEIATSS